MVHPVSSDPVEVDFHMEGKADVIVALWPNKQSKVRSNVLNLKSHSRFYIYFGSQFHPLRAQLDNSQLLSSEVGNPSLRRNQVEFQPKDGQQILNWSTS